MKPQPLASLSVAFLDANTCRLAAHRVSCLIIVVVRFPDTRLPPHAYRKYLSLSATKLKDRFLTGHFTESDRKRQNMWQGAPYNYCYHARPYHYSCPRCSYQKSELFAAKGPSKIWSSYWGSSSSFFLGEDFDRQKEEKIKRPMNAFMVWSVPERKKLAKLYPSVKNVDISRMLGTSRGCCRWKVCSC